jgi:Zn finger protein HypA/HybF involved in hydrogenase expression
MIFDIKKEFVCRKCCIFLDSEDLVDGCCPDCGDDDCVFANDISDEEE